METGADRSVTHVGVALTHPANARVVARMSTPRIVDRDTVIRAIERRQAQRFSPALARALDRLRDPRPDPPKPPSQSPDEVDRMNLGTHPDIIDRLWDIGRRLPTDCRWVAFGQPVLAHSRSGVIFGLGVGTLGYGLRLPPALCGEALAAGAKVEVTYRGLDGPVVFTWRDYGEDWWFGRFTDSDDAWARAAYDHFGA